MINELISKIRIEFHNNKKLPIIDSVYQVLYDVLVLKYLCDNKKLSYDEIMNIDDVSKLNISFDGVNLSSLINYKKLLHEIQYENLENMIIEFINLKSQKYSNISITSNKKIIYFESYSYNDFFYDLDGKSTYILNENRNYIFYLFQLFDRILQINNEYKKLIDINFDNYEELHFYCTRPSFNSSLLDNRVFDKIVDYVNHNLRVFLYTNYNRVNNYKNGTITLKYLKNIIFRPLDITVLIYEKKDNDEISIINYDSYDDLDKLKNIIRNNRLKKNVLIKVSSKDIYKNNYRLGFRLYQLEYDNKNRTINEIVDYNSHLITRLERINEVVEKEINMLINK